MPYEAIRRAMRSQVWAIMPDKLEAIQAFLQLKAAGKSVDAETLARIHGQAQVQAARASNVSASGKGAVAVLPLYGLILHRGSAMDDLSGPGAASVQRFTQQFRQALNDPNVQAIVIDIDSPGGTVEGVDELASEIRAGRAKKKIVGVSNCLCASAAYYIASACTEIWASPSSLTGSVGVYCSHEDDSAYLDKLGVKVTMISYGDNKTAGNPYEALTDSARADMQEMVTTFGQMFEAAIAKGRAITQAKVHSTFGQGKVFTAQKAREIGMVDKIGTLDDVLATFGVTRNAGGAQAGALRPKTGAQASAESPAAADAACTCTCPECESDDCPSCSHEGCNCAGCECSGASALRNKARQERRSASMRRRLDLATA